MILELNKISYLQSAEQLISSADLVRLIENSYYVTDLGSTNGTLIAGRLLQANESQVLNDGEFITIGRLGFVFMPPAKIYDLLRR